MLAGRLPWDASEAEFAVLQRKHQGNLPPPTAFYPEIPPWVVKAVMAALQADPGDRTASVAAFEVGLQQTGATPKEPAVLRGRPGINLEDVDIEAYARVTAPAPPSGAQRRGVLPSTPDGRPSGLRGFLSFLLVFYGAALLGLVLMAVFGLLMK